MNGPACAGRRRLLAQAGLSAAALGAGLPWRLGQASTAGRAAGGDTGALTTWVGPDPALAHRLRGPPPAWPPGTPRRVHALVLGAGVAGLAAARALQRRGVDDIAVLEMAPGPGGNSRALTLAGLPAPTGAHYLPVPVSGPPELSEWLHEIGLLRVVAGRTVPWDEHLCHSPQERLFVDGEWVEGLLPPAEPGSATAQQYGRFAQALDHTVQAAATGASRRPAFSLPAHRSAWTAVHEDLNRQTLERWLQQRGLDDERLRWYLDYCCLDEYGADAREVSAWAGLHYFASRHGFHVPDGSSTGAEAVFTWPQGNAWLVDRLAAPLGERVLGGRLVLRLRETRHQVQALVWRVADGATEVWEASRVVLALPLIAAARVWENPPTALQTAAALVQPTPWLVANLALPRRPLERPGLPQAWDSVVYGQRSLGVVDATHQALQAQPGATVWTAYFALPAAQREALASRPVAHWREVVLQSLRPVHPDIDRRVGAVALTRWGHAMAVPRPGVHRHPALQALRGLKGRVRLAHSDLAGYSVFEEAFVAGIEAGA